MSQHPSGDAVVDLDVARGRLEEQLQRSEDQLHELESTLDAMQRDQDTIQEDYDDTRRLIESVRADVQKLRRALARIDAGTYGRCVECGSAIARERLEAIPAVDHCARCA